MNYEGERGGEEGSPVCQKPQAEFWARNEVAGGSLLHPTLQMKQTGCPEPTASVTAQGCLPSPVCVTWSPSLSWKWVCVPGCCPPGGGGPHDTARGTEELYKPSQVREPRGLVLAIASGPIHSLIQPTVLTTFDLGVGVARPGG